MSQSFVASRSTQFPEPVRMRVPSGENATDVNTSIRSEKVRISAPVAMSQSFAVPSIEPVRIWVPSGENAALAMWLGP